MFKMISVLPLAAVLVYALILAIVVIALREGIKKLNEHERITRKTYLTLNGLIHVFNVLGMLFVGLYLPFTWDFYKVSIPAILVILALILNIAMFIIMLIKDVKQFIAYINTDPNEIPGIGEFIWSLILTVAIFILMAGLYMSSFGPYSPNV